MKYQTGSSNFFDNGSAVVVLFLFIIVFLVGKYVTDTRAHINELLELNQQQEAEILQQQELIDSMFKYIEVQQYLDNNSPLHKNNKQPI